MDLVDTDTLVTFIAGLAIVVGILGVIVPVLPGLPLCWGGVLLWAIFDDGGWTKWVILGIATVIALIGAVVQWSWPGRNLKRAEVPNRTLLAGGVLAIVGFLVVPVVGLILGFVLGVWLAEYLRLRDTRLAWPSTKHALKAAGLSMLIELGAAFGIAAIWVVGLLVA